jgi:hypothetical protein
MESSTKMPDDASESETPDYQATDSDLPDYFFIPDDWIEEEE